MYLNVLLQGLNFLRMSARVDGVASRVQSAIQMRQVYMHIECITTTIQYLLYRNGNGTCT